MAINKVIYGNDTLIDLTSDTVDSSNLLSGYTAHDRSGASIVGSAVIPTVNDGTLTIQKNGTNVATFSANQSSNTTANILVDELTESTDNEPYTLRQGKGDMVDMSLVGGSFAWNQLVSPIMATDTSTDVTFTNNGDGSFTINGTATYAIDFRIDQSLRNGTDKLKSYSAGKYLVLGIPTNQTIRLGVMRNGTWQRIIDTTKPTILPVSSSDSCFVLINLVANTTYNNLKINPQLINLTQLFGTTIADAIYAMEQATAGSGVAWFRQYFPNAYYAYDAGSIESVNVASRKVVGKNLLQNVNTTRTVSGVTYTVLDDGSLIANRDSASSNISYFTITNSSNTLDNTQTTPFKSGMTIYVTSGINGSALRCRYASGNYAVLADNTAITLADDIAVVYVEFTSSQNPSNFHFYPMIRVDGDNTWQPYEEHVYPFDTTKQLRGIPSIVNNKLVYDGDIYTPNGITRKYGIITFNGTETWYAMDNSARAYTVVSGMKSSDNPLAIVCSSYPYGNSYAINTCWSRYGEFHFYPDSSILPSYDSTGIAQLRSWLSSHPITVVYEKATPTTESAEPYQNPQRAFANGTEEFVDFGVSAGTRDVSIPCGHNSTYKSSDVIQPLEDYTDSAVKSGLQYYESMIPIKLYATGSFTSSTSTTTTVTATNANISIDSTTPIEVFTDVFGVNLTNMSVSGSGTGATISITFPKMSSAQTVNYRVYIITI